MPSDEDKFREMMGSNYGTYEFQAGTDMYQSQVGLNNSQSVFNYWQKHNNRIMARVMGREALAKRAMWLRLSEVFFIVGLSVFMIMIPVVIHLWKVLVF